MTVAADLADYLRMMYPFAFCAACLAKRFGMSVQEAQDAAEQLGRQVGYGRSRRACYGCGTVAELTELRQAG